MLPLSAFVSEGVAASLLRQVRWDDGVECPRCRSDRTVKNGSYREYQRFLCKDCGRTFNDKTGTVFAYSKLPLQVWFCAMYLFLRVHTSLRHLARELPVRYRTIKRTVERFLRALDCRVPEFGETIEIDEVYATAGRKGHERDASRSRGLRSRGRGTYESDQPPILVIADRDSGDRYTIPVTNADSSTIKVILGVEDHAEDDPLTVYTDEYSSYEFLDDDDRFQHETVVHGDGEFADGDVHVNTCESQGSLLRPWLSRHRGLSKENLTLYLRAFDLHQRLRELPGRDALKLMLRKAL
jgi:transposase-like protein